VRRKILVVGGAVTTAAVVVAALLLSGVLTTPPGPPDSRPSPVAPLQFADGALLPQEVAVLASPQADGTLAVQEKVVFDTPIGSGTPLVRSLAGVRIGWMGDRSAQYGVLPVIDSITAHELKKKTSTPLVVTPDQTPITDPYLDARVFRVVPDGGWTKGRHVVTVSYQLRDVYVSAEGVTLMVLPLSFFGHPDSSAQRLNVTRARVSKATALRCLADDVAFADQKSCPAKKGRLAYRDNGDDHLAAVAVVAPQGVTASPQPATVRKTK